MNISLVSVKIGCGKRHHLAFKDPSTGEFEQTACGRERFAWGGAEVSPIVEDELDPENLCAICSRVLHRIGVRFDLGYGKLPAGDFLKVSRHWADADVYHFSKDGTRRQIIKDSRNIESFHRWCLRNNIKVSTVHYDDREDRKQRFDDWLEQQFDFAHEKFTKL
jgi:hypothetical protein